jgi:hypothetical protein
MKLRRVSGLILIILGAIALAYQGFTYTTRKKVLDIGPVEATKKTEKTIPLPPILGGCALAIGVGLMIYSNDNRA